MTPAERSQAVDEAVRQIAAILATIPSRADRVTIVNELRLIASDNKAAPKAAE